MRRMVLSAALLAMMMTTGAVAQEIKVPPPERVPAVRTALSDGDLTINVVDVVPRFLDFHQAALDEQDADRRFAIWQARYGFAAVPPGPQGEAVARQLLDAAWPRYARLAPSLTAPIALDPLPTLRAVADLLDLDAPFVMQLTLYVGAFEGNAFTASHEGMPIVALPVEGDAEDLRRLAFHEFTHAVHQKTAGLSGAWERPLAQTMISEGLAMHATRDLAPGLPDSAYVEFTPGWFAQAQAVEPLILAGVRPHLADSDSESVFRFTMGEGPAGLEREAYYAGWRIVQALRDEGMSLAEIARISEQDMPAVAARALDGLIDGGARVVKPDPRA